MHKLFAAALLTLASYSQVSQSGPQVFTYLSDVDDTDQPYAIYIPVNYDGGKKWPLVISLHGAGSNHRLNMRRVFGRGNRLGETDAEASRHFPPVRDVDFIVASPFARGTMGYQGIAERDVYDVLAQVRDKFNIDEDRIYLTGLSMGGGGALWLGLTRPDIWAAIAPVCPFPPAETAELAGNALNVPVKMFQGALDPLVKVDTVRLWQKRFLESGVRSEYVEYPTVRHNAWDTAYRDGAIFDWFRQHRRVHYPNRVQFAARDYAHASAYWVRFDNLTPGTTAQIDAAFTAKNSITVKTANLDGFTLQLKAHPMAVRSRPLAVVIDGARVRARAGNAISFAKSAKGWTAARPAQPKDNGKRADREGPLADAVASRHIYIYGTADGAPAEEITRRQAVAKQAADWAASQYRLTFSPRVLADAEVKDEDLKSSNLILFGTKATNTLIARFAPRLPFALNPGAADYSLTYVFPIDGRYVLVNSGLPWWTRADQATRGGMPFLATPVRTLQTFGDFILFRGGLNNVIAEGRFDRAWNVPEEMARRMHSTGAVEVRQP